MKKTVRTCALMLVTFFLNIYSHVLMAECDAALEENQIDTFPLEFNPSNGIPTPPIPTNIGIGAIKTFTYTVTNHSTKGRDMTVISALTPSNPDLAIVVPAGSTTDCSVVVPLTDGQSCTITVQIDPSSSSADVFLTVNYTVDGDPSCFDDITSEISYHAVASYAYVTNKNGNTLDYCTTQAGGSFDTCTDSGFAFNSPTGVAIPDQTFSGNNYAYVSNASAGNVSQCQIDVSTGALTACPDSGAGTAFVGPSGLAFETADDSNLYSYVMNAGDGSITQCTVDPSLGTLGSCVNGAEPFNVPYGTAIQTVNATDYSYTVNKAEGTVTQCTVDASSGLLTNCLDSGAGAAFTAPENIAFFTSDNLYAYITDPTVPAIWQCDVDSTLGTLSGCVTAGVVGGDPRGIAFDTQMGVNYAIISMGVNNGTITCILNSTGNLTACTTLFSFTTTDAFLGITEQTFNSVDYMYAADVSTNSILQCKVYNVPNGIGNLYCLDSGIGTGVFTQPASIEFQASGGSTYAYVPDSGAATVWQCLANITTGTLSACVDSGASGLTAPFGIAFDTVNSTLYAYVSDAAGIVWQCSVNSGTGALSGCIDAGQNITPPYAEPIGLSAQTFSGTQYLYVGDLINDDVYQCALNATTGLFTACVPAVGPIFHEPGAFTFETIGSNIYAYITNTDTAALSPKLTTCIVDPATGLLGTLTPCIETPFDTAQAGIAFVVLDTVPYAYVTENTGSAGTIVRCGVDNSNGTLSGCPSPFGKTANVNVIPVDSGAATKAYFLQNGGGGILICDVDTADDTMISCTDAGSGFSFTEPTDIAFQSVSGTLFAYITDQDLNTVTQCTVDSVTGILSGCVDSGQGAIFLGATGISFDTVSAVLYAYVVNSTANEVMQCTVDGTTGLFTLCSVTASVFTQPVGIAFDNGFAYITDVTANSVFMCQQNPTGTLIGCKDSGQGPTFAGPSGIAFFLDVDGDEHVYINNIGSQSTTFCALDPGPGFSTGMLVSCADSGVGAVFSTPAGIGFQTYGFTTSYAYILNADVGANNVFQCTLNNDGSFAMGSCVDSGVGNIFDNPFGIAFFNPAF